MTKIHSFTDLPLIEPIRRAIAEQGYTQPTPIQAKAIPHLLEGRDLLGCAQTGTGKTAAFALPILQRLAGVGATPGKRPIRCLILTPTRELAAQIDDSFRVYGRHLPLHTTVVFGGVGKHPQAQILKRGVDVLVATPGRLLDHMQDGLVDLRHLEVFVLDEADRMLDMGFIHDVRKVIRALPKHRQSLFFSATMPKEVAGLADSLLNDPVKVEVVPQSTPAERIQQLVLFVDKDNKNTLLADILESPKVTRALVFARTKHGASRIARHLGKSKVKADAIHGDRPQNARTRALEGFREGKIQVLVATDIAARGIDIDGITHVINYDLPNEPESYVHRIGRTARAGMSGIAISFCAGDERDYLQAIEKTTRIRIPAKRDHPYHSEQAEAGQVNGVSGVELRKQKLRDKQAERQGLRGGRGRNESERSHPAGSSHPSRSRSPERRDAPAVPAAAGPRKNGGQRNRRRGPAQGRRSIG